MSVPARRLVQQTADEWTPTVMDYVAVIDRGPDDLTAMFGWTWVAGEEPGLGRMGYVGLAYDGRSRFVLMASDAHPERGIALEAPQEEVQGRGRADFVDEMYHGADGFVPVRKGRWWFGRGEGARRFRARRVPGGE